LHLEMLSEQRTPNAIHEAAEKLPSGLDNTYNDIMERISKQVQADIDLALKVLSWVTYAKRPLVPKELQHAVATGLGMTTLDDGDLTDVEDMLLVCAGIVIVDSNVVRLVHYTTQGYLEKRLTDRKVDIARGCLSYLGLEVFREPCQHEGRDVLGLQNRINDYPFVRYAAIYWSDHIRRELENELKSLCFLVFKSQDSRDALQYYLTAGWERFQYAKERSLLHMFAESGLTMLCRHLLDNGVDSNEMYHYSVNEI
jgi:hypothetical protein